MRNSVTLGCCGRGKTVRNVPHLSREGCLWCFGKSYIWTGKDIPENGEDFGLDLGGNWSCRGNGFKDRKFWR